MIVLYIYASVVAVFRDARESDSSDEEVADGTWGFLAVLHDLDKMWPRVFFVYI